METDNMADIKKITTPLTDSAVQSLNAGDQVAITGVLLTGRDQAHKRLCQLIDEGKDLPVDLAGQVIYFVGPTPAREGRPIGSAGPTTSSRMDAFSGKLIAAGLKGMIGKGNRSQAISETLAKYTAVHFAAIGGAGALLSKHIIKSEIIAYEDLGTEAIRRLEVVDFPVIVAYDCRGNNVYDRG
jgi:fumarate hydratase subunit beta